MKHISIIFVAFLLIVVGWSCNGNKGEEDFIMEDVFEVDLLMPTKKNKETILESLLSFMPTIYDDYGDTVCITIGGSGIWSTLENNNPYSIKINDFDTSTFFVDIEGLDKETFIKWYRFSYRPLTQIILTILDTCSYSLHCDNFDDVSPQTLLDRFRNYDSIAYTDIFLEMCLVNDTRTKMCWWDKEN